MAKNFKSAVKDYGNPALGFLTVPEAEQEDAGQNQLNQPQTKGAPKPKRSPSRSKGKAKRETKTAHVHLLMTPSLHAAGTKAAEDEGVSFAALLTQLLEDYLDGQEG